MAVIVATALIELTFDTEDGLVLSADDAREEMIEYLASNPIGEFDITITTTT